MNLHPHPLFLDVEKNGLSMLYGNRYCTIDVHLKSDNIVTLLGRPYFVHKGQTLKQLDNEFIIKNQDLIEVIEEQELSEKLSKLEAELNTLKRNTELEDWLVKKVFPYVVRGVKEADIVNNFDFDGYYQKLEKIFGKKNSSEFIDYFQSLDQSILEKLFFTDVLFVDTRAYFIHKTIPSLAKLTDNKICINNRFYLIQNQCSIDDLKRNFDELFKREVTKYIANHSIKNQGSGSTLQQINYYKNLLTPKFQIGPIGFQRKEKDCYLIYHIEEPWVIKNGDEYYKFNPCTIAVKLDISNKGVVGCDFPIIIDGYSHPALPNDDDSAMQEICIGNKDTVRKSVRGVPTEEKIWRYLYSGISAIGNGYVDGANPYHHLGYCNNCGHDDFTANRVTEGEVRTNNWRVTGSSTRVGG